MSIRRKVLVVDEDRELCHSLLELFTEDGAEVLFAHTAEDALSLIASHCPDIIILELNLPDKSGMEVLCSLRKWSLLPVLVYTNCTEEKQMVEALDAGADDYIVKPCSSCVLQARIRAAFRHTRTGFEDVQLANEGKYEVAGLTIDYNKYRVYLEGEDVNLTQNEFRLVALLGKYAGKVLTYKVIKKELWGPNTDGDNLILRVNMRNIRKKLGASSYILTEKGVGYRLISKEEVEAEIEKE